MTLPSTKPYLVRAIHEWCADNGFTPYLAVAVDARVRVPLEFVRDGQIVLNVGLDATNRLTLGNEFIDFQARFGGVARDISVPLACVTAIYARENGVGMAFELEAEEAAAEEETTTPPAEAPAVVLTAVPELQSVPETEADASKPESDPDPSSPPRPRPTLQRIK
ncbi:MAG: ClpXP protease specificity-enhancing factor [Zoogloeaceae bacterium]|nr:ClpXP protease specificity-enhancing factor [Zoogloeaceae bacterium]